MRLIPLTQGKFALCDGEDYDWLMTWKWCAHIGEVRLKLMAKRTVLEALLVSMKHIKHTKLHLVLCKYGRFTSGRPIESYTCPYLAPRIAQIGQQAAQWPRWCFHTGRGFTGLKGVLLALQSLPACIATPMPSGGLK